jgi:hypothetical protein
MNEKAVKWFLKTGNAKQTAEKFGCSESSVRRWTKQHTQAGYTLARCRVLKKYDLNGDGVISLQEYLTVSKRESKKVNTDTGDAGGLPYHYQNLSNIFNYLFLFLSETNFGKYAAIPDSAVMVRDNVVRSSAAIDCHNKTLFFPKSMVDSVRKAIRKPETRFVYFTLTIFPDARALGHVNACIIDTKQKTLERFETYGKIDDSRRQCVDQIFDRYVMQRLRLNTYNYLRPLDLSPAKGIQTIADSKNGMCVTIVMMYFQMRIMNPDRSQKNLVKELLNLGANELKHLILKYADYVRDFMQAKGENVKQLNREFMHLQFDAPPSARPTKKIKQFEKLYKK